MTRQRTQVGRETEAALDEVLAHVRGETPLPCRFVDDPAAEHIVALRKRMKLSRQKFAGPVRTGCPCRAGLGTGPTSTGPGGPSAAGCYRPRSRGGRARTRRVVVADDIRRCGVDPECYPLHTLTDPQ